MATSPEVYPPQTKYPAEDFRTMFADSVLNVARSSSVVKFYLARTEPSFTGDNTYLTQPFAQIVMPIDRFIQAVLFFEQSIDQFVNEGAISQEQLDQIKQSIGTPSVRSE
jgi:hypothetical protein